MVEGFGATEKDALEVCKRPEEGNGMYGVSLSESQGLRRL